MGVVRAVVIGGCVLIVTAGIVTLSHSPTIVAAANTPDTTPLVGTRQPLEICQTNENLPRGTSAIRLHTLMFTGARVAVRVLRHEDVVAHGEQGSGWAGGAVTVPVDPLPARTMDVTLCFTLSLDGREPLELSGEQTTAARAARSGGSVLPGRVGVEYLRSGRSSWFSLVTQVARRMGLGHAASGTWGVLAVLAIMAAVVVFSVRLIVRELR